MSMLTINSLNQGFRYDEAASGAMLAFATGLAVNFRELLAWASRVVSARPADAGHLAGA